MSRSKKKAIIKDNFRRFKKSSWYWRIVRSSIKNYIRSCKDYEIMEIPNPKTIINDYDYCDYIVDFEYDNQKTKWWTEEDIIRSKNKNSRK